MKNKTTVRRDWSISIIKNEIYHDVRYVQIDLSAPSIDTSKHSDKSVHNDRVMPLVDIQKLSDMLDKKTKAYKGMDNSHFWVSGYYAIYFHVRGKKDRIKIKKIVKDAVIESGGFMSWNDWYKEHQKGSGMTIIMSDLSGMAMSNNRVAFL